ncbi:hypothetical protein CANARDRAFT_238571 [[Candida] arabinofermentans NRRL YB-2248]|uniref:mRNA-capping enzyme subunit alpha n=1 Tax=[Candida] arabinofermentans NRRL YB-2248 TaxID=983967 RepID=A0A1E4SUP1_9ASCO|nr:hypothetical protein CANARDRAFT_238571 [[Candida] arabinofermentans NRRL YB-2248]
MSTIERGVPDIPGDLVNEEVSNYLKTKVSQILRTRYNQFPGSQPVSFTRDHLHNNLMNKDYLVCEKSDGLRCLLFVLINQDTGEEGTFLINRENDYYMIPNFHFPRSSKNFDSSHNGTIVDGELVYSFNPTTQLKEIRYLIFDCLSMDMQSVMHKNLWKRLYHAQQEFHKPYMDLRRSFPEACSNFPFKLDFKNMTQPFKIKKIFKEMKNLTYVSDGLILTCCDTPYITGTDSTLLKWKPIEENTIDFKMKLIFPIYVDEELPKHDPNREYPNYDAKPIFKLYVWKGGDDQDTELSIEQNIKKNGGEYQNSFKNYELWDNELSVSDEEWEILKKTGESFNGRIVEVRRTEIGEWKMLRFRDDKSQGNYINVVSKVLKSIEDSVSREELENCEDEIKNRWNQREKMKQMRAAAAATQAPPPQQEKRKLEVVEPKVTVTEQNDDDEYYESDGFEDLPSYSKTHSPKYGELNENESKRRKV